ncbi:MAG: V-type ATP synthase subunit B [Nanoarchaeota archaeon]|nr:V-type ATP synthase subunit B [Nanoarchaeota archaeon]
MIEYYSVDEIKGPIVIVRGDFSPMLGEMVSLDCRGKKITAQVLETSKDAAVLQSFSTLEGIKKDDISVGFSGELFKFRVSKDLRGRIMDGLGNPIDSGPLIYGKEKNIEGNIIRPSKRQVPRGMIETGISSIDLLNTLIYGQKLPIFTGSGLSHLRLIGDILKNISSHDIMIVFGGIGLSHDELEYINHIIEDTGVLNHAAVFLNSAIDPVVERIILPRIALTCSEYFAFEKNKKVLTILYDMTNYADALREISSARGEFPGRQGYPPYLYTDLASLFERCGIIKGMDGSLTLMPVLTMPNGDITHPVPDLTGYITEGQILLSRALEKEGIFPPVDIIPSLSRLMHHGTEGIVRKDFSFIGNLLYSSYARYLKAKKLKLISGIESLSQADRDYLNFGDGFERKFLNQTIKRSMERTLRIAWNLAKLLPDFEDAKIPDEFRPFIDKATDSEAE